MKIIDLFKQQLDAATPSDGNYLQGETYEECFERLVEQHLRNTTQDFTRTLQDESDARSDMRVFLDRKIQEWKNHAGERLCFYLVNTFNDVRSGPMSSSMSMTVYKLWESEIPALEGTMEVIMDPEHPDQPLMSGKYPRFIKK